MTNRLFYVVIRLKQAAHCMGTLDMSSPFPQQLPVVAGSFSEAIDRVRKEYGNRCTVTGVSLADSVEGMAPLL